SLITHAMKRALSIAVAILLAQALSAKNALPVFYPDTAKPVFKHYKPCTFSISLPSTFTIRPIEKESSPDYCDYVIKIKGKAIMQVHSLVKGRFMHTEANELFADELKDTSINIVYKIQKDNWYVISGKRKRGGNNVYSKLIVGEYFISDFTIEYADKDRA